MTLNAFPKIDLAELRIRGSPAWINVSPSLIAKREDAPFNLNERSDRPKLQAKNHQFIARHGRQRSEQFIRRFWART